MACSPVVPFDDAGRDGATARTDGSIPGVDGGADGGRDAGPANQFRGGPCIATTDGAALEILARGTDSRIHRSTGAGWEALTGLDTSVIDVRSDLDCAGSPSTVHLVALGTSPAGAFLHARGLGATYNAWEQEYPSAQLTSTPSIAAFPGFDASYFYGYVLTGFPQAAHYNPSGGSTDVSPPLAGRVTSAPDLWMTVQPRQNLSLFAAFNADGELTVGVHDNNAFNPPMWHESTVPAPSARSFEHSPSVCALADATTALSAHLFVVASGQIYHAVGGVPFPVSFSTWELVASNVVRSAPDCTVTADGQAHVVALSAAGTVLLFEGNTGSWAMQDLGLF